VTGQVKGFTEAQIREMATRGAALDGTRPSDRWRRTEETFGDNYLVASNMPAAVSVDSPGQTRPAEDADSRRERWQGRAKIDCRLQAS
jgi:phosphoadenosine phosphosulfate reductase